MLLTLQNVILFYSVKGSKQDKVDPKKCKRLEEDSNIYMRKNIRCLIYSLSGRNYKLIS
jgi:hypothetical protein